MVQKFLPDVALGDKRIVLVDGVATCGVNRLPKAGEIRSNLAVGCKGEATALTPREAAICAAIGTELARRGRVLVGIDVLAGRSAAPGVGKESVSTGRTRGLQ